MMLLGVSTEKFCLNWYFIAKLRIVKETVFMKIKFKTYCIRKSLILKAAKEYTGMI